MKNMLTPIRPVVTWRLDKPFIVAPLYPNSTSFPAVNIFGTTIEPNVLSAPIARLDFIAVFFAAYIATFVNELLFAITSFATSKMAPFPPTSTPEPPINPETTPDATAHPNPSGEIASFLIPQLTKYVVELTPNLALADAYV